VWDPPSPKPVKKKSNWGGAGRKKPNRAGGGAGAAGGGGYNRGNPLGAYGNVDNQGAAASRGGDGANGGGRRNYDKPWLAPEKEKKAEAKTYADHVYPDGIGPDTDLINMIERDALVKNPHVNFDDIADLDETKKLL